MIWEYLTVEFALHLRSLRCEYRSEPEGIDQPRPRLMWKLESRTPGEAPSRFRVRVAERESDLDDPDRLLWDSGEQENTGIQSIGYDGPPLVSVKRYFWAVTVWSSRTDRPAEARSSFSTGILHGDEWAANWIGRHPNVIDQRNPMDALADLRTRRIKRNPYLRRSFQLQAPVRRATVLVTARGLYRLQINGKRIGTDELTPGWTDYTQRLHYQTYDVTGALRQGENVAAVILADGWWSGYFGQNPRRSGEHYGTEPQLWFQLHIEHTNGSTTTIVSDDQWREQSAEIRYADLIVGEWHDAARALPGWDTPGFDASDWNPVRVLGDDASLLHAATDDPPTVVRDLPPVGITATGDGRFIVDMGQNMVGRIRLRIRDAPADTTVRLRHAEILEDGELSTANLRSADATDVYVTRGDAVEVFEPLFTVHGFRYVEVTGYPTQLTIADLTGRVLQSPTPQTGTITTSSALVNQLQSNIEWGQRGNFLSIPTDCPQRDERLGWTADAQIFLPTASYNADVAAFFTKWMQDVRDAQGTEGDFPNVAPRIVNDHPGAPAWGDAGVLMPWHLYRTYGDLRLLAESFDGMTRWVDRIHRYNPNLLWLTARGPDYGDWLQMNADTPREVLSTAYFARDADLIARAARVLGRQDDAAKYQALFEGIRAAFVEAFVGADGSVTGETQTGYALALAFDLIPDDLAQAAADRLARNVRDQGMRLTTGFVGVAHLLPQLSRWGHPDIAYALLEQTGYPSWGYTIGLGATTIWERWDALTVHAGLQRSPMNSFNHYSLGSVGEWLYAYMAGIRQPESSVAYRQIEIAPQFGGTLTEVTATFDSPRGLIGSHWTRASEQIVLDVQIPPGEPATVILPTASPDGIRLDEVETTATAAVNGWSLAVPSGAHSITVDVRKPGSAAS